MGKKELLTDDQRENILELNQLSEFEFASYYSGWVTLNWTEKIS